jgi:O-antigen/teichoic acid export membrane protein
MAWTLANVPLEKVTSLVTVVVPSYLVAVQDDLAEVRRYLRNLTESIALITFPACVGLGITAPDFVPLILGHKWDGAIVPLQVLSVYTALRSIVALLPKLLTALNEPRFVMWNDLATLAVLGGAFVTGSHWGIAGIAWGWVLAYPLVALPLYRKALGKIHMTNGEYFRSLRPALEATIVMTVLVEVVKYGLSGHSVGIVRLMVEVATGAGCYVATLFLFHRQRMDILMLMAKRLRQG